MRSMQLRSLRAEMQAYQPLSTEAANKAEGKVELELLG